MRLHSRSIRQWNTWSQQLDGRKHRVTPHPLRARRFATVARCLGNQNRDVGVRVRSILLRYAMTVMRTHVRMDGSIDAYLEQSDDDSDSCTEAGDGDSCREASDSGTLEEDSDPCTLEDQWDRQDDSTYASTVMSHIVDDLTPQQRGDTSEDSHVLAPTDDQLPLLTMTHLSSFQTPMTATSHEDSNNIEDSYVRDAHHGHVDPQIQEGIYDV
jgi:hypothetical protein